MSLTGHEDHSIDLNTASTWTKNYRDTITVGAPIAEYFGKDAILAILNQDGCVGIRLYYAINDVGERKIVVVGVKSDGNDIYLGVLAERSLFCPPSCSVSNPLNT